MIDIDKEKQMLKIKAELFDLQVRMTTDRHAYQEKLKELNRLIAEEVSRS